MTQETVCPACGAPLTITSSQEAVRCSFCGAELHMEGNGAQPDLRVINRPEPQKETLSKPVEGHGDPTGAARVYAESGTENAGSIRPDPMQSAVPFDTTPAFSPEAAPPAAGMQPRGLSGVNRWIVIGGVVILGLFLLCACLAVVVMAVMRNANF